MSFENGLTRRRQFEKYLSSFRVKISIFWYNYTTYTMTFMIATYNCMCVLVLKIISKWMRINEFNSIRVSQKSIYKVSPLSKALNMNNYN